MYRISIPVASLQCVVLNKITVDEFLQPFLKDTYCDEIYSSLLCNLLFSI